MLIKLGFILAIIAPTLYALQPQQNNEKNDIRLKAPWIASIFTQDETSLLWKFLCAGTITSPTTVITSARCIIPRLESQVTSSRLYHVNYKRLRVIAGLAVSDVNTKDQFSQESQVGQIRDLHSPNLGDTPDGDLAALRLRTPFHFTDYVKSVEVTDTADTILEARATLPGSKVTIASFPITPSTDSGVQTRSQSGIPLEITELIISGTEDCINHYVSSYPAYRFKVVCGRMKPNSNKTIPCHGYQGAGMIADVNSTQYLLAVYSSNSAAAKTEGTLVQRNRIKPTSCSQQDVVFFTKLGPEERWAESHNFCDKDLAMCDNNRCRPWSDLCDGIEQCSDGSDERDKMCRNQGPCSNSKQWRCAYGACIDKMKLCDGQQDCRDGSDENDSTCKDRPKTRSSKCPQIPDSKDIKATCSQRINGTNEIIPCDQPIAVGGQVILQCHGIQAFCMENGSWSRSLQLSC